MISINYRDPRPLYEQVKDSFRRLMVTGVLAPGDRLPSVRELASQLAINPNTIQRAYRELEADGYIYSVPGKGSFASNTAALIKGRRQELLSSFDALSRELAAFGVPREELIRRLEHGDVNSGGDEK